MVAATERSGPASRSNTSVGGRGERRVRRVGDRHGRSALLAGRGQHGHDVGRRPRLRERDDGLAPEVEPPVVHGVQARRGQADGETRAQGPEVLRVAGGVVGAAAGDQDDAVDVADPQRRAPRGEPRQLGVQQARQDLGLLGDLGGEQASCDGYRPPRYVRSRARSVVEDRRRRPAHPGAARRCRRARSGRPGGGHGAERLDDLDAELDGVGDGGRKGERTARELAVAVADGAVGDVERRRRRARSARRDDRPRPSRRSRARPGHARPPRRP